MSPGQTTSYGYDLDNNLTSVTDANQNITTFGYDDLNRRNFRQLPLMMSETSVYDAVGNLTSRTDFNGKTTTFAYDSLNRVLSKTPDSSLNEPTVSFAYTGTGKRSTMQDASGLTTYQYDNRDRLNTKITPEGTLSYTYDGTGNALSITSSNPNGASLSYTYDVNDRLSTVADNRLQSQGTGGVATYNFDAAGNLASYVYPSTVSTSYTYDKLNRVVEMKNECTLNAPGCNFLVFFMAEFNYTRGRAGNITNVSEGTLVSSRNVSYGYDNDYRLTSQTITGDPSQNGTISYTYDPVGNRTQQTSTVPAIPSSPTLTYNANDQLSTDPYDNNGNLLNSGTGNNNWDFENRLIQAGSVTIVYDGDGNRVQETAGGVTTQYLVDDVNPTGYPQVVDELVNGSVTRTYAYGLQHISENQLINGAWTPSFYGYDAHGNVRFLTPTTPGKITDNYEYDAFGNLIASTGSTPNNYLFAGEQFDPALGIYVMRARWYRETTGRFLSRDPIEGVMCCGLSWNPYIYVKDNAVDGIDPGGRDALIDYMIELGEDEETIAHARLTAAIVRNELYTGCLVEQFVELYTAFPGIGYFTAAAEAAAYCNALYPPVP